MVGCDLYSSKYGIHDSLLELYTVEKRETQKKTFISQNILVLTGHQRLGWSWYGHRPRTNQVVTHLAGWDDDERVCGLLTATAVSIGSEGFLLLQLVVAGTTDDLCVLITVHNVL